MTAKRSRIKSRGRVPVSAGRMLQAVREAEKSSHTGATGFTLLKLTSKPIARLIDEKKIGPVEFQSAREIETVFFHISGALMVRHRWAMERSDPVYHGHDADHLVDAQVRYKRYAQHWSMLAKRGDKTLQIVIAAVIDERPFHHIEADLGMRHGKARKVLIRGLRDYAARAGWTDGRTAATWKAEAGCSFPQVLSRSMEG